tara:strand:+ start:2220 stop:2591 length:372 start_codon:yes stop_codon:yes gene_type:complete
VKIKKISKLQLRRIIKEELRNVLKEAISPDALSDMYREDYPEFAKIEDTLGPDTTRDLYGCFIEDIPDRERMMPGPTPYDIPRFLDVMYLRKQPSYKEMMCMGQAAPEILRHLQGGSPPWIRN